MRTTRTPAGSRPGSGEPEPFCDEPTPAVGGYLCGGCWRRRALAEMTEVAERVGRGFRCRECAPGESGDCYAAVARAGWPAPPRSACWMCPNMGDGEWREMRDEHPADFARAVEFERQMRERDPAMWLHESCRPLDEVDFTAAAGLFDDGACASGMCFV